MLLTYKENVHSTQMYIPLKPLFSRHKGIGVQFTDEPTGNLDSKSTENVMEYLVDINRKFKITLVMVTHDSYAASFCDKVILLKDGIQFLEIEKNNKSNSIFLKDIYELLKRIGGE